MKKVLLWMLLFSARTALCQSDLTSQADGLLLDSKFEEAITFIDKSIALQKDTRNIIILENKKAQALTQIGKFQDAEELLKNIQQKLDTSPDGFLQAVTQSNLGFLQLNQGRNDLAKETLQKAIAEFEQNRGRNQLELARALATLGLVLMNTGNYTEAEEQLQLALSLRKSQLSDSNELIAATYNDLGLVYSQIDNDKALDYYEKALAIYTQLHNSEHSKIAFANINIGVIYRDMGLFGDAINNFETALKIWDKIYPQAHQAKAIALYNLGQSYVKMGYAKGAIGYYERALGMYEEMYGKKHPELANILNAIGNLQFVQKQYNEALVTYQKALKANVSDFESDNISINPSTKNYYHGTRLLQSLLFKAQALEERYFGKTLKLNDLILALKTLHQCDSLIDELRQQSTNESDKILIGIVASEVYADGVRISHEAAMNAVSKNRYFEKAFYFAEKSKSAVLLEAISDAHAKSFSGIPPAMLDEERELKSALALCSQRLAQRPSAEEESRLRRETFTLNRKYASFIQSLEKNYPDYFSLKYNQASPSIEKLQSIIDPRTELLSYFLDEKNNHLYIFQITQHTFKVEDKILPADFDRKITALRNSLYYNTIDVYRSVAYELYKLLIPKRLATRNNFNKLVILPVGRLSIIPFETLLTSDVEETENDFKKFPYLVVDKSIQYQFASALMMPKAAKKSAQQPSILLCAPVTFSEKENLSDLPGTEKEVREIGSLFKTKNFQSQLYNGKEATEKIVKSADLMKYSFLHLATHGVVDEQNPELSRVILQSDSKQEDGNLYTAEIYNLALNADLVTLSACETGLGKISKGEGVIGLSRALVYAGAHNIIVSFWSVADESTAELMKDFYKLLLENNSYDYSNSLRLAKLHMIETSGFSAPYYWAPFILIGF